MKEMKVFNYGESEVRIMQVGDEPWFVLRDVCKALDLGTPARVAERLDGDEVSQTHIIDSMGRQQETTIINESGLYNVILRSNKPEAKPFRRWVTHEVLPSIRRTGAYGMVMPSVYPPKATSVGEVAQLLKILRATMKDNRQPPEKVSEMVESVCSQFGIILPPDFVKEDLFQFAVIGKLIPV